MKRDIKTDGETIQRKNSYTPKERQKKIENDKPEQKKRGPKKIPRTTTTIQIPTEIMDEIERYCELTGMSKASFFSQAAMEKLHKN
jgi:hypothetical protein